MKLSSLSRRQFLNASAAVSGAGLLGLSSGAAFAAGNRIENIGIQLYTVRNLMAESVPNTLGQLAAMGYSEVEFAGYFKHSPADIKRMVADAGLTTPSTHIGLVDITLKLEETMDAAAEIGHDYVVLAYLMPKDRASLDQYKSYIDVFSAAGEAAKKRGMHFGYHNHDFEFKALDGVLPYDLMLEQIDSDLMKMTMDLFWINHAGKDPFQYFDKHPGRFKQCHVKDAGADGLMTDVGTGTIDFGNIFAQREKAGFEHYYVEHDMPKDALATAKNSADFLQALRF